MKIKEQSQSRRNFILRVAVERVEDLNATGKRSVALQVGHDSGGVGNERRRDPAERSNFGANGGAVELASFCLHDQIEKQLKS
jgi:hypothetical protein